MTTRRLLCTPLLVLLLLAACGSGADEPALSGEPIPTTTSSTAAGGDGDTESTSTTAPAGESTSIELTGAEYVYSAGVPTAPVPAGEVTVSFANIGQEEHQATLLRFKDGKTLDDLIAAGDDPSQLATVVDGFGGPNAVAPGATVATTQTLVPGDYLFICLIPGPDGQPHALKGMLSPFTVEGDEPPADAADAGDGEAVALDEYTFGLDDGASFSSASFGFANDGEQLHESAVYALAPGATAEDAAAFFLDPSSNPPGVQPPVTPSGGISALSPGNRSRVELDLPPGEYVMVCFIPDAADGAPHLAKGMIQTFTIE